ncbi:uL30 family ribosomal protein [Candidatus Woesearchaeota archaeon]|nr:uL30 family ribosomal protein [Candidatus Woesearchaeota archaeon]
MSKIAVVRVRGLVKIRKDFVDTLRMLNLDKKNHCVIVENNSNNMGMIKKVKDFVAWGEVNEETIALLESKKKGKFYSLQSPKKGFGRKGIKMPFSKSGGLGYRGVKINDLLKRMI